MSEDIDIIKKVLDQEVRAQKRYSIQLSEIFDEEVRSVLKKLYTAEKDHVISVVEAIKELDPSFNFDYELVISNIKDEDFKEKANSLVDLKGVLEVSLEKEKIAARNYEAFEEQLEDPKLKTMIRAFKEDELEHKNELVNLLLMIDMLMKK